MPVPHAALRTDPRLTRLHRIKPLPPRENPADLVRLPLERSTLIYKRLSSHEQKKKSIWSLEMQAALVDQARTDGYTRDQIIVEERDLGISGTKGAEHRPGLAAMIEAIETGAIESVYVVHISRLTRDQTLIDGMQLGELFKRRNVVLCLPTMRLNLRDPMHMRLYRMEIERAADEITLLKQRLGGAKRFKSLAGRWDGRSVPAGYLVDQDPTSPTYEHYVVYEPHADVVSAVFAAVIATGTPTRAARWLRERGIFFPDFPVELSTEHATRSSLLRSVNPARCPGGFTIPPSLVTSLVTNPVYLGWWLVDGQVVKTDNHPALVDGDVFLQAQEALTRHGRGPGHQAGRGGVKPQLLSGLVRCGRHEIPAPMLAISTRFGRYHCHAGYRRAQLDHHCTLLDARVLDEPVEDVVLNRCGFAEHADAVLAEMESEYHAAQEEARRRQRELARLEREVATLRENLALTRTPDQVQTLFDLIESRTARMKELADVRNSRVGRMLTAAQVVTVRSFLANLRTGWSKQPLALKNELLRLLLDRVDVNADRDRIIATVVWHSGDQQTLHIARPPLMRDKVAWTPEDDTWLRERYADAPLGELQARFPNRTATAIRNRAKLLNVRRARGALPGGDGLPWDAAEDAIVRAYVAGEIDHPTMLSRLPRRSRDGIRGRMQKLRLRNPGSRILYHVVAEECGMLSLAGHPWRA